MSQISISSPALALRAEKPLTPAMISALWEIVAVLDEERVPAEVPNAVWLTIPTKRLRGPGARQDNIWLRQCLERMTGLQLSGEYKGQDWIAVMIAEAHFIEGGAKVRLLIPPAGVHALRSPGNFAKIETDAVHRLPPHAKRLYALLADKKRQREPYAQWGLTVLRGLFGVDDKRSYDRWNNLRARVIDSAIEAINDFGTVRVKMTPIKQGRSVAAVRFDWTWKDPHDASETAFENDRHSAARRKAQKADDAPPMIEEEVGGAPAAAWWATLSEAERERWSDDIGRSFEIGGNIYPRRERDIAVKAFAKIHADADETPKQDLQEPEPPLPAS